MSLPGRPKGDFRSAQHEGTPVSLHMQLDPPACERERLRAMIDGFWTTQAIGTAAALGLPALLAQQPCDDAALALATGCHFGAMQRLMHALTSLGLCTQAQDGRYALTAMGQLLAPDAPESLHGWARLRQARWGRWGELETSVRDGRSWLHRRFGVDDYGELDDDAEQAALFHRAMVDRTRSVADRVFRAVGFDDGERLVDVGGGSGELLLHILLRRPTLSGVIYDRADACAGAQRGIQSAGIAARCEFVEGSFFDGVPIGAEVYLLKSVLHNWNDERVSAILRQCRAAMSSTTRLLIIERLAPEHWTASAAHRAVAESDLNMMVARGGCERSERQFGALMRGVGLRLTKTIATDSEFHVLEARQNSPGGFASV
jgi:orsellinic acid C2-O-methyltransferase